jgi:trimeric autotransporter adhesin
VLKANTTGSYNTANANGALFVNTTGDNNTAEGVNALFNNTTGSSNIALGFSAGNNVATANDVICIGAGVTGANLSHSCFIGNIRGVTTQNANAYRL